MARGFLCTEGIAFKQSQSSQDTLLLFRPDGTITKVPEQSVIPYARRITLRPDVQKVIAGLRTGTVTKTARVGSWYWISREDGSWRFFQVTRLAANTVQVNDGKAISKKKWRSKLAVAIDTNALAESLQTVLSGLGDADLHEDPPSMIDFPCIHCPAQSRCPQVKAETKTLESRIGETRQHLRAFDPVARISAMIDVLDKLQVYDPQTYALTDLGRALLATHDAAGLFFALKRKLLGTLSPLQLASVIAATRDIRTGRSQREVAILPEWYRDALLEAARIEQEAGGFQTLAAMIEEAKPVQHMGYQRYDDYFYEDAVSVSPSPAEQRAHVLQTLWNGRFPRPKDMEQGDAERLLLMTIDILRELRRVPELAQPAETAYAHLSDRADQLLVVPNPQAKHVLATHEADIASAPKEELLPADVMADPNQTHLGEEPVLPVVG